MFRLCFYSQICMSIFIEQLRCAYCRCVTFCFVFFFLSFYKNYQISSNFRPVSTSLTLFPSFLSATQSHTDSCGTKKNVLCIDGVCVCVWVREEFINLEHAIYFVSRLKRKIHDLYWTQPISNENRSFFTSWQTQYNVWLVSLYKWWIRFVCA